MEQRLESTPVIVRQVRVHPVAHPPPGRARRSPFWWLFGGLAAVLIGRNHYLFTTRIYEEGDAAANSILVDNAKHLSQLVGNYSRLGFHHPGPAFLYVHAFGEWLFHDVLHIVPSPWNGQALAVLLLNAAIVALAVTIVVRWLRTAGQWVNVAVPATALIFLASWADLVTSTWPPFEYFAPYLLLLAAGASVAAGGVRDLWALCLASGLLIHGHAEFLFLATALALPAVLALVLPHRSELLFFVRVNDGHLGRAGAVVVVAAFPIALDLSLRWPGEFGRYLGYSGGHEPNGLGPALWYVARMWDMNEVLAVPVLVGSLVALVVAARRTGHPYLRTAVGLVVIGLATVLLYAIVGVDSLGEPYILFFTRAFPLFALMVTVGAIVAHGPGQRALTVLVGAGALLLSVMSPALMNRQVTVNDVPQVLDQLPRRRPIVLRLATPASWAEALPLAVEGRRRGLRLCFVDPAVEMMATPALMCDHSERSSGLELTIARRDEGPSDMERFANLGRSEIWVPAPA